VADGAEQVRAGTAPPGDGERDEAGRFAQRPRANLREKVWGNPLSKRWVIYELIDRKDDRIQEFVRHITYRLDYPVTRHVLDPVAFSYTWFIETSSRVQTIVMMDQDMKVRARIADLGADDHHLKRTA
jgi:hypothetical protein